MKQTLRLLTQDAVFEIPSRTSITARDLRLHAGEILLLTGASGSGKTCFLDRVAAEVPLVSGTLRVEGRVVRIHQDLRLVRERSAFANVMDGALALRHDADASQAMALMSALGIAERKNDPVYLLSLGEAQRVAIARALMAQPDVLLADEPFAALDEQSANRSLALLHERCKHQGMAALIVTHKIPAYARDHALQIQAFLREDAQDVIAQSSLGDQGPPAIGTHRYPWAWLSVVAMSILAFVWLIPALQTSRFSWEMLGQFMAQWLPTAEKWQAIPWGAMMHGLADTLALAVLGTLFAIVVSLPLAMLATGGLSPRPLRITVRSILNWWRAIPSIIWALIGVSAVGLGAVSGLLALVLYSMGYLTKFFYESFEQVDRKPAQYLAALGATRLMIFRRAILPMTLRSILASSLFMLEYNVRAASVLGIVGAGGIGVLLKESIEWANWHVVGIIIALLGLLVLAMDTFSSWLRRRLLPERTAHHS